jgi:uncharacterized protein (DUF1501 family)
MITRRFFLKSGALAIAGLGASLAIPSFLERTVLAANNPNNKKIMIVIFQRGAADGLNIVVPFGDTAYYKSRPTLAIAKPSSSDEQSAIDLDGFFGLHPALKAFKPFYDAKQLAVVHAAGSPDSTRSHFDAQDYMEIGTPGIKSTPDGWLNRYLQTKEEVNKDQLAALRGIAIGNKQPRALAGSTPSLTVASLNAFEVRGGTKTSSAFETMYGKSSDDIIAPAGVDALEAMRTIRKIRSGGYSPSNNAIYPNGQFGNSLKQIAQLIKSNVGLEIAFADLGGWDTHTAQKPRLNQLLKEFSSGIAALYQDLGDKMQDIVIVTMSEFGRTVKENGTAGTDHGHANCMFVMGGGVKGGKVYGKWPGLEREQLYEARDLALTTDFRTVCGEVITKHCGAKDLTKIFPKFQMGNSLSILS